DTGNDNENIIFENSTNNRENTIFNTQNTASDKNITLNDPQMAVSLCYKPAFYYSEQHLAKLFNDKISSCAPIPQPWLTKWLNQFTAQNNIELSPQQYKAVLMAGTNRVMILTGGPGCGKTFSTKMIVALWQSLGLTITLAAPTGRAAKRLQEMTGVEAKTIHRLLEFSRATNGFKRNEKNPLPYQAIVIDEASMLDLFLAHSLLKAIPKDAYLLLVGDVDQLPSVGPGNVLKDLIDSQQIPVMRLTQIFRQAQNSGIIQSAHAINKGQYPPLEPISHRPQSDCLWHNGGTEPEHGLQLITELVTDFLPPLGFDVANDLQVLCPMTRGLLGTRNLNQVLQAIINPPENGKTELKRGDGIFREGDRIIQLKNDYDKEVFNGDLGIIKKINTVDLEMIIGFDDRDVVYDYGDLNEISLAYAVTIHKSQGSEYPVVILPIYMQHYMMLSRNLFYTGLTRAKQMAIIIGQEKPIAIAVKQVKDLLRYTKLKERLVTFSSMGKYPLFSGNKQLNYKVAENKSSWDDKY
ncbi:ATP-dependent DNA helicase, partial [Geminocystis sp. CENA526]|uniref:SF1B family DNA helicase RecD2 n=1 Tax=Geminocystis sp. CENA526 TaxID=1355871 RepID=UPI003D6DBCB9